MIDYYIISHKTLRHMMSICLYNKSYIKDLHFQENYYVFNIFLFFFLI